MTRLQWYDLKTGTMRKKKMSCDGDGGMKRRRTIRATTRQWEVSGDTHHVLYVKYAVPRGFVVVCLVRRSLIVVVHAMCMLLILRPCFPRAALPTIQCSPPGVSFAKCNLPLPAVRTSHLFTHDKTPPPSPSTTHPPHSLSPPHSNSPAWHP